MNENIVLTSSGNQWYIEFECNGRDIYTIDGKVYDECGLCKAACPSKKLFKDSDSGLPLKCDMCEEEPHGGKKVTETVTRLAKG